MSTAGRHAHDTLIRAVVLLSSLSLEVLDDGTRVLQRPDNQAVDASRCQHAIVRTEGYGAQSTPNQNRTYQSVSNDAVRQKCLFNCKSHNLLSVVGIELYAELSLPDAVDQDLSILATGGEH